LAQGTPALPATSSAALSHRDLYRSAIYQSAVRRPSVVPLATIEGDAAVTVIRLAGRNPIENGKVSRDAWVSLPSELLAHCRGKPNPVLAIRQVLGLPPEPADPERNKLFQFAVPPAHITRPCASGASITETTCGFDLPKLDTAKLEDAKRLTFLIDKLWNSYRADFPDAEGYPFTGMGWSYNWNPESPTPVGVSEFIVAAGAEVSEEGVREMTPAEFCGSAR
jgi:hypothetical protein